MKKLVLYLIMAVLVGYTAQAQTSDSTKLTTAREKVSIFPNPFSEKLTIKVAERSKIKIYNSFGVSVHEEEIESSATIDTGVWKSGIYMVIVIPEKNGWNRKEAKKISKIEKTD